MKTIRIINILKALKLLEILLEKKLKKN